jgi:hypothetical protein
MCRSSNVVVDDTMIYVMNTLINGSKNSMNVLFCQIILLHIIFAYIDTMGSSHVNIV